jgi:23S rRNA pseudouridine1911/1915/1917 synthase
VLAVAKPPGLVTQPSGMHADSLETRAKAWLKREFAKPGNVFLEAVHRIDRPVSGVVLFARTSKALSRLNRAQREKRMQKRYWAVVEGSPQGNAGRAEHWLVHGSGRARVVPAGTEGAKQALLDFRVLGRAADSTCLEIDLLTGRYHQIRAQFAALGCPILGDTRYGSETRLPGGCIALHHRTLVFPHPVGGTRVSLVADLPAAGPWANWCLPSTSADAEQLKRADD